MNSRTAADPCWVRLPSGERFPCARDESVFAAMRRALGPGVCGCFGGGCGACRMRVASGEYATFQKMSRAHVSLTDAEDRVALLCCIRPLSDLTLEPAKD